MNIGYKEPKIMFILRTVANCCELLRTVANTLRINVYTKKEHSIN